MIGGRVPYLNCEETHMYSVPEAPNAHFRCILFITHCVWRFVLCCWLFHAWKRGAEEQESRCARTGSLTAPAAWHLNSRVAELKGRVEGAKASPIYHCATLSSCKYTDT